MFEKKLIGIAACDSIGTMGNAGSLPWHNLEDLKHFSDTTLGHPIVMGYRTFLTLPRHYLDQRLGVVFSHPKRSRLGDNIIFVSSLAEFHSLKFSERDVYVIGGAEIFTLFLKENLISEFILTRFKGVYEGDTFFPLWLLDSWESLKIRENVDFNIYQYFKHTRIHPCK